MLPQLERLKLNENGFLSSLPRSLTALKGLKYLGLKGCGFVEFPDTLLKMSAFPTVDLSGNDIRHLGEEVVKVWRKNPNIVQGKQFVIVQCDLLNLEKPPYSIFEQGPEAWYEYYCSMKLTSEQSCSFMNVQVLGETGSGKTSLIQTMKNEEPSLVSSPESLSDSSSVCTVKLMEDDVLVQIYDYDKSNVYDLAYHVFIKSIQHVVILAVNLPEYSEAVHDTVVTRWLSSIYTTSVDCPVIVVGTQADRCTKNEIKSKRSLIQNEIDAWPAEEIEFLITSSANMKGIKHLLKRVLHKAKKKKVVLPKHWRNMYTSFYQISGEDQVVPVSNSQSEVTQFFTLKEANATFMQSFSPLTKWVSPNNREDFRRCLQFFNDIGMLLWYKDNNQLQNTVFHSVSFLISALQHLFKRDIQKKPEI